MRRVINARACECAEPGVGNETVFKVFDSRLKSTACAHARSARSLRWTHGASPGFEVKKFGQGEAHKTGLKLDFVTGRTGCTKELVRVPFEVTFECRMQNPPRQFFLIRFAELTVAEGFAVIVEWQEGADFSMSWIQPEGDKMTIMPTLTILTRPLVRAQSGDLRCRRLACFVLVFF